MFDTKALKELIKDAVKEVLKDFQQNESKSDDDDLMTVSETAKYLGLAKNTIYQKASRMEIPHFKKGKKLYFSKKDLLAYLHEGRVKTQSEIQAQAKTRLKHY